MVQFPFSLSEVKGIRLLKHPATKCFWWLTNHITKKKKMRGFLYATASYQGPDVFMQSIQIFKHKKGQTKIWIIF